MADEDKYTYTPPKGERLFGPDISAKIDEAMRLFFARNRSPEDMARWEAFRRSN